MKIKNSGVISWVISATESAPEESERLHFLPTPLMTPSFTIKWKPDCRSRKQTRKDKLITMHVSTFNDWFSSRVCFRLQQPCFHLIVSDRVVSGIRTLFSLDRKALLFWLRLRLNVTGSTKEPQIPNPYLGYLHFPEFHVRIHFQYGIISFRI